MSEPIDEARFPVIDLPPEANTPEAAVQCLIAELVRVGKLPGELAAEVTHQVWHREKLGSTATGRGVAIPHARNVAIAGPVGVVGRCTRPLDWPNVLDGGSVWVVCLIVASSEGPGDWLRHLERLVRTLRNW